MLILDDKITLIREMQTRFFNVSANGRIVPGVLWLPTISTNLAGLILIGHGGSGHKLDERTVTLASTFVQQSGFAVAAIDGPVHGNRRADSGLDAAKVFADFQASLKDASSLEAMTADWQATLTGLASLEVLANVAIGFWGLSMGAIYGLGLIAAQKNIKAAVVGLVGVTGNALPPVAQDYLKSVAAEISCPLLFLAQLDDEYFPLEGGLELFQQIISPERRMHLNPGGHAATPPYEITFGQEYLVGQLKPPAKS